MTDTPRPDESEPENSRSPEPAPPPASKGGTGVLARSASVLRTRRGAMITVGVALAAVIGLAVVIPVTASGDEPVPEGTMPTLDRQYAPPDPASDAPGAGEPDEFDGEPEWLVPIGDADVRGIARTDDGYVIEERERVRALDQDGSVAWKFTPPDPDALWQVRVTDAAVLVSYENPDEDRWPQPDVIIALDPATGKRMWTEKQASFWAATADTVYLSVCFGGQNNHVGDCRFSARDVATNTVRWAVPTYASAQVTNDGGGLGAGPTPPYLLIESFPTGYDSRTNTTLDADTGRSLGAAFDGHDGVITLPNAVVSVEDYDDNPADGCAGRMTGYDLASGARSWRYTPTMPKDHDGRSCQGVPDSVTNGRMGVTTGKGKPAVLNLTTGKTEWTAPDKGSGIAASAGLLLAHIGGDPTAEGDGELVLYDVDRGAQRWRLPSSYRPDTPEVTFGDGMLLVWHHSDVNGMAGYDARTGESWRYPGRPVEVTGTELVTCDEPDYGVKSAPRYCRAYSID